MYIIPVLITILFKFHSILSIPIPTPNATIFDAIEHSCRNLSTIPEYKEVKEQDFLKACPQWSVLMQVNNLTRNHEDEFLCWIYYKEFTNSCKNRVLTKDKIAPNVSTLTLQQVCEVFPKVINTNTNDVPIKSCKRLCTDPNEQLLPVCGLIVKLLQSPQHVPGVHKSTHVDQIDESHKVSQTSNKKLIEESEPAPPVQPIRTPPEKDVYKPNTDVQSKIEPSPQQQTQVDSVPPQEQQKPAVVLHASAPEVKPKPTAEEIEQGAKLEPSSVRESNMSPPANKEKPPETDENPPVTNEKSSGGNNVAIEKIEQEDTQEKVVETPVEETSSKNKIDTPKISSDNTVDITKKDEEGEEGEEQEQLGDYLVEEENSVPNNNINNKKTKPDTVEDEPVSHATDMDGESYFFSYFMVICVMFVLGYVGYHNRQKIMALMLEGKRGRRQSRGRRPNSANYHKLDSNLEEAISSSCSKNTNHVIY